MRSVLFFLPTLLIANTLTIYNNNLAAIKESKKIALQKGVQEIKLSYLPDSIILDSIMPHFQNAQLLSLSFKKKSLNLKNILKANLNKSVQFYTKDKKVLQGKLLSINPTIIEHNNSFYIVNPKNIIYSKIPQTISTPTLTLQVKSPKNTQENVELFYLMRNINWKMNYTLLLNNKTLTLKAFAKVHNASNKDFKNYKLFLIAGEIHTPTLPHYKIQRSYKKMATLASAPINITPKEIKGYYKYKVPFQINLNAKETKHFSLFNAKNIPYKEYAQAQNSYFNNYGEQKLSFSHYIEFKNNTFNMPLPKGIAKIYQKETFLGEDIIKNTPKNEKISLKIGNYFMLSGTKKITKFISRTHYKNVQTTYTIKNSSKKDILVKIKENIPRYGDKINFHSSCKNECKIKKESAFLHIYNIKLKANSTYSFFSEFETYY